MSERITEDELLPIWDAAMTASVHSDKQRTVSLPPATVFTLIATARRERVLAEQVKVLAAEVQAWRRKYSGDECMEEEGACPICTACCDTDTTLSRLDLTMEGLAKKEKK